MLIVDHRPAPASSVSSSTASAAVSSSAGRPTRPRNTSASVRRSKPKRLTGPGSPGRVEGRLGELDDGPVAGADAQPDGTAGVAEHREAVLIEGAGPGCVRIVWHVDEQDRVVTGDELVEGSLGDGSSVVDDDGVLTEVLDEVELV